jgi:hypothetical protein
MYLKLAFRNAKRSLSDYFLYIISLTILITIMIMANYVAIIGKLQVSFKTSALPLLITLILIILVKYINTFMLKQRAKEFANYVLLGIEKNKISWMFFGEFITIGSVCFILASLLSMGVCAILLNTFFTNLNNYEVDFAIWIKSLIQTLGYFCLVQLLSSFLISRKISKLQIQELMVEKKRNQSWESRYLNRSWGITFIISMFIVIVLLLVIALLPEEISFIAISLIMLPLLVSIISFYYWLLQYLVDKRKQRSSFLYQNNRLYLIAQITSQINTNALMNSIYCICLFFSAQSFMWGNIFLQSETVLISINSQQWMGFIQIVLSIIFIVIFFSALSLQQMIEIKQEVSQLQNLYYIGKSKREIRKIGRKQILLKFSIPTAVCYVLLLLEVPLLNYKLNHNYSPLIEANLVLKSLGGFTFCFLVLNLCYFVVVYLYLKRYLNKRSF